MGCMRYAKDARDGGAGLIRDLAIYWLVNAFLHLVNLLTSTDSYWAIWPALGWGLALALRALRLRSAAV